MQDKKQDVAADPSAAGKGPPADSKRDISNGNGHHTGGSTDDGAAASDADAAEQQYLGAPNAVCELNRIKHLHDLNILYTPPEQRFDDITRLCTLVFKVCAVLAQRDADVGPSCQAAVASRTSPTYPHTHSRNCCNCEAEHTLTACSRHIAAVFSS